MRDIKKGGVKIQKGGGGLRIALLVASNSLRAGFYGGAASLERKVNLG